MAQAPAGAGRPALQAHGRRHGVPGRVRRGRLPGLGVRAVRRPGDRRPPSRRRRPRPGRAARLRRARGRPTRPRLRGAMSEPPPPRLSPAAAASLALGLASVVLFALTGVPALVLGLRGLRAVNASEGRLKGRRLAVAGMALGAAGTLATLAGVCAIIFLRLNADSTRLECANHLRQIGQAVHRYSESQPVNGALPPGTMSNPGLPPDRRLSWFVVLLPFFGEDKSTREFYGGLAAKVDRVAAWDEAGNAEVTNARLRVFQCRGPPAYDPRRSNWTHYVGLTGVDPGAAELPTKSPRAGAFGDSRLVTLADATAGISFTMMATETGVDNGPWAAGGRPTL